MGLPQTSLLLTICATVIFCVHSASLPTVAVGTITGESITLKHIFCGNDHKLIRI